MKERTIKRRNVLRGMAAGTGGSVLGLSSLASAMPSGGYSGIAYDTLTHETTGPITGNIEERDDGLRGTLKIAGYTLPLKPLSFEPTKQPGKEHLAVLTGKEFAQSKQPLKFRLTKHHDHYAGILSRPSGKYGRLGYFLYPDERGVDPNALAERHEPHPRWKNGLHSFAIPKKGLPTDSGLDRLTRLAHEGAMEQKNGGRQ